MDPALLRERELFKKRALATPTVEKKKKDSDNLASQKDESSKKKAKPPVSSAGPKLDVVNYKTMTGSSQYKFGVLAKIVKHMRSRHQEGDDHPLTLEEILDETSQLDVGSKVKQWLLTEALINNPKIEVTNEGKFIFKASYKIRDKKGLLRILKQHDLKGLGGILLEDIQESLPHCEKALKKNQGSSYSLTLRKLIAQYHRHPVVNVSRMDSPIAGSELQLSTHSLSLSAVAELALQNEIIYISRPIDKKKIVFYNDKTAALPVDEEFQKLWRSVAVESMDDQKIEEYLEKQGIRSMQDHGPKKVVPHKRKKPNQRKKQLKRPRDNEHLADVLETYDDK